ncbi:MAG TPA: glycosyltransferase family 2 protein [Terriglobales bacterium]|nr:glycosyltransferase family 2 protein [Terriglobales bacterium]
MTEVCGVAERSDGLGRRRQSYWVVLPAYNEELSLPQLLNRIHEAMTEADLPYTIIIINDGSRDATAQVARSFSDRLRLIVENHPVNMGLGATLRDGLLKALASADAEDVVITMDADNSHNPELMPRMGRLIREGNEVVIASRYQSGSMVRGVPAYRRALSLAASALFRCLFHMRGVKDYTCGFRAYRAGTLQSALNRHGAGMFDQEGFQCIADLLLKLRSPDLAVIEVPMVLRYDLKKGASKMNVMRTVRATLALVAKRRLTFGHRSFASHHGCSDTK